MVMIEGKATTGGHTHRIVVLVTGTCWSPKVFEFTKCRFEDAGHVSAETLPLPSRCILATRRNKVSERFMCVDHLTSDELTLELVRIFSEMRAWALTYKVVDLDGTLMWSEITGASCLGCLWRPDQKKPFPETPPMDEGQKLLNLAGRVRGGNPLDPAAKASSKSRPSRGTPGARQDSSARGRKRERDNDDALAAPLEPSEGGAGNRRDGDAADESTLAIQAAPAIAEEIMDLADEELASLAASDLEELDATYIEHPPGLEDAAGVEAGRDLASATPVEPSPRLEDVGDLEQALADAGVDAEGANEGAAGAAEPSAAEAPPEADNAAVPEQPGQRLVGPSPGSGYVYEGGRSVLRIQRGKPANRVTINCYLHPRCTCLVNENRAPPDQEIFQWLYEVERATADMSASDRKALTDRHKALARARWTAPLQEARA